MSLTRGWRLIIAFVLTGFLIGGCGFHLQGEVPLAPPLKKLYIQTDDPYGSLSRDLEQNLKLSHVTLVNQPEDADTILVINSDTATQNLQSVSGTQQTRQYNLVVTVVFGVTDKHGSPLIENQTLQESRSITVQSNQILGSSNEATLYYQQMRRILADGIMSRLSSAELTNIVNQAFAPPPPQKPKHTVKKKAR